MTLIVQLHSTNTQTAPERSFISIFREFNLQDAVENEHSKKTVEKYQNFTDNFEKYLQSTGNGNLSVTEINVPILKYFTLWLTHNLKSCNRTHISKHIYRINKAVDYAVQMGLIPHSPTSGYKVKRAKSKPVVYLENSEFELWVNATWQSELYQKVKDCYTFQMTTGLSYMDLFTYKTATDKTTGNVWIEGFRGKTGRPYFVPLYHKDFATALELHKKYDGKFPRFENHVYNRYIREMSGALGIDKYLKTHTARKTFATLFNQDGYEVPPIAAMLGNTDKICESDYIGLGKKKIITALLKRA